MRQLENGHFPCQQRVKYKRLCNDKTQKRPRVSTLHSALQELVCMNNSVHCSIIPEYLIIWVTYLFRILQDKLEIMKIKPTYIIIIISKRQLLDICFIFLKLHQNRRCHISEISIILSIFSSYLNENTLLSPYKNSPLMLISNRCLLLQLYETQRCTLWANIRMYLMLTRWYI